MATCTCGGEIGGYCATGKENTAMAPVSVMTTDSTVAKIGRSMKKCENMSDTSLLARRRLSQTRHGHLLRLHLHVRADLLERPHGDPLALLQPLGDDAQAVRLERPGRDAAVHGLALRVDHVDVFQPLVR